MQQATSIQPSVHHPAPDRQAAGERVASRLKGKVRGRIFTDPLIILSGALLLDSLTDLRFHRWTYAIGMTLFVLHIAVGQAEPIKYAFKRTGPQSICEWNRHYIPLLPLHWCPARS